MTIPEDNDQDVASYAQVELPQRSRDFIEGWNQAIQKAYEIINERRYHWIGKRKEDEDGDQEAEFWHRQTECTFLRTKIRSLRKPVNDR